MVDGKSEHFELLDQIAEEFAARYRAGERPSIEEYVQKYPELAADIRELIPTLAQIEQVEENRTALTANDSVRTIPPVIGDYRILREIGQGGMGVVYEAEQVSLGRRVALKILPPTTSRFARGHERFRREARAAAKLHHTNIVPVYDIGQDSEICFYAMQFIVGQGLDRVIDEIRRLRHQSKESDRSPRRHGDQTASLDPAVQSAARSMLTGHFAPVQGSSGEYPGDRAASADQTSPALHTASIDLSHTESGQRHFFQCVACIGRQVANALAYAHDRGVVHRDIKPSNLLLDSAGVVWVTDFGLAKTGEDGLTQTGDMPGTLRYMAPERFRGEGDHRVDIYALGLTLYEMLALRPAFAATDRLQLMDLIRGQEPIRLRAIDPRIPKDLETICQRCLEKEPGRRYASASDLADDLQRFIEGRPVRARPLGAVELMWRWCQRYPAIAALTGLVMTLIIVIAVGSSLAAWQLKSALSATQKAEAQTSEQLIESLLAQADANRKSRRPGQRFETLRILNEAKRRADHLGNRTPYEGRLRDLAMNAMSLPDLSIEQTWPGRFPPDVVAIDADDGLTIYARTEVNGRCTIRRFADEFDLATLPGRGVSAYPLVSRDGGHLTLWSTDGHVAIWSLGVMPPQPIMAIDNVYWLDFSADHRTLTVSHDDGRISVYTLPMGQRVAQLASGRMTRELVIAAHPQNSMIACCSYFHAGIIIRDRASGAECQVLELPANATSVAWDAVGRRLAAACNDRHIYFFDTSNWQLTHRITHDAAGLQLSFLPGQRCLLATDWNFDARVWDVVSGRLLGKHRFEKASLWHRSSTAGGRIGLMRSGSDLAMVQFADGSACLQMASSRLPDDSLYASLSVHPTEPIVALNTTNGATFFDSNYGVEWPVLAQSSSGHTVQFIPSGAMLSFNSGGVWSFTVDCDQHQPSHKTLGPPNRLSDLPAHGLSSNGDGSHLTISCRPVGHAQAYAGIWNWHRDRPEITPRFAIGQEINLAVVSPDGRWGVRSIISSPNSKDFCVVLVDELTGQTVRQLSSVDVGYARFSPDSQWFFLGGVSPALWKVADEAKIWSVENRLDAQVMEVAFSPDGKLAAMVFKSGVIELCELPSCRLVAKLDAFEELRGPCFSQDGRRLFAISRMKSVVAWDLATISDQLRSEGMLGIDAVLPKTPRVQAQLESPISLRMEGEWRLQPQFANVAELAVKLGEQKLSSRIRCGVLLKRLGCQTLAQRHLETIQRKFPRQPAVAYELGLLAIDNQDWPSAEQYLAKAQDESALQPAAAYLLQAVRNRIQSSVQLRANDGDRRADELCYVGFAFFDRNELGPAIVCFEEACRINPRHALALRLMSRARLVASPPWFDAEKALSESQHAVEADPSRSHPRVTVGIALLRLGRLAEARAALEAANASIEAGQQGINWYYQAIAAAHDGDRSAADKYWQLAEEWWVKAKAVGGVGTRSADREMAAIRREVQQAIHAK